MMKILLAALALLVFAGSASADTWKYTGNTMNGCNCALSGSVTLDGLAVTSFVFTDGTHTLTSLDSVGYISPLGAFNDPTFGPFAVSWYVNVRGTNGWDFYIDYYGSAFEATEASGMNAGTSSGSTFGYLQGNHGLWSDTVSTPEPGTLALIGVGLAGLLARKRLQVRRKQVPEADWVPLA